MAQFVEIKLKPGDESVYSADCNNMTAPNGAELDDKQFVFSIFLNGSSTQSFGGKAVSNVSWTDSTNRSEKGRSASNTSIQGADPVLRHDGLYCSDSFPVLIEFQARLNYGDGSTEIVKAAVKIEKS